MDITNANVKVTTRNDVCQLSIEDLTVEEAVVRIQNLNGQLADFWSKSAGWAPVEAAGLLGKSRLDWQVSLSSSLSLWVRAPTAALTPAELILAWVNLGSLIEGTIRLLLSAYYHVYEVDIENLTKANAFNKKKQVPLSPDGLQLQQLRVYCAKRELLTDDDLALVELVQQRRNAIHAFKDRPIGDRKEFQHSIKRYLQLLRNTIARLPYPSSEYVPAES